jgi:hypothetical protein
VKFWRAAVKAEAMSEKITFGFEKLKVKISYFFFSSGKQFEWLKRIMNFCYLANNRKLCLHLEAIHFSLSSDAV